MIKLIEIHHRVDLKIALSFSDGTEGVFDGNEFLKRNDSLRAMLPGEALAYLEDWYEN